MNEKGFFFYIIEFLLFHNCLRSTAECVQLALLPEKQRQASHVQSPMESPFQERFVCANVDFRQLYPFMGDEKEKDIVSER